MNKIKRLYESLITDHLLNYRQMILLPGPRQVGKTTLVKGFLKKYPKSLYLNWDNEDHRNMIEHGLSAIVKKLDLENEDPEKRMLILDEIHKFPRWKNWLKGLFDTYEQKLAILVTGSAKLNIYKQGQDSMMGRYYLYHVHPLSVAELIGKSELSLDITPQQEIDATLFNNLLDYGGFPEPFIAAKKIAHSRWSKERNQQLIKEDLRDITQIREISQIQLLARMLSEQVGQNTSYSSLARKIQVSHTTIKQWLETLKYLYHSFHIRPWSKNITRSLIKEPKYYLWDWSQIRGKGARRENFVASHLLNATHYWTEIGLGTYELFYLRDKQKREVDFIVVKDDKPWFLVEVKTSENNSISASLRYFHEITKAPHAFQLTFNSPYADVDCFSFNKPIKVSVKTFLSQLV